MFKPISFVFLVLVLVQTSFSQEYFESNTIVKNTITLNNLYETGYGRKIFNLLGLENNTSVHKIKLDTKSRLLIRISRDADNELTAKISLTRVDISGNTNLHDFNIDSLLWPSGFTAKLTVYNAKHKRGTINIIASANGKLKTNNVDNILNSYIGDVSATVTDIKFNYDEYKYQKINNISQSIGYYYSYGLLLTELIDTYSKNVKNSDNGAEIIFIDKILINRVSSSVDSHKLVSKLSLNNNDPISFLKLKRKLQRLSNRAETLFIQQIQSSKPNNGVPLEFCDLFCRISTNFLGYTKTLQPSDARGFEEIAQIDNTEGSKENLVHIIEYYSGKSSLEAMDLYQIIFNNFVSMANEAIINNNYTDALLLLNNSLIIHNWFNTNLTSEYNSLVSFALDGVASSYLRVGVVALRAQNNQLADKYFNKADVIVMSNNEVFESIKHSDTAFSNYLGLQYKIAMQFIEDNNFKQALTRLSFGSNVCSRLNNSAACNLIDSITCIAHSGIINNKLDSLNFQITAGQFPDAYEQLGSISQYIVTNSCNNKNDSLKFTKLLYSLFIEFLQQGEILIDAQQSKMALYKLLKAQVIQEEYLHGEQERLLLLIKFAAEPEITKLIDEAKYHTWANRMDEAALLSKKAKKQTSSYFGKTNARINKALAELDNQMLLRKCISYKVKYDDAIKKIHIAIKYNNYNKLNALLVEAQTYVTNYPECTIQNTEVLEFRNKYDILIDFYNQYDEVTVKLFEGGYEDVINKYAILSAFYVSNNLSKYNINFADVKAFIIAQNLPNLTIATAEHYVDNNDSSMGFEFVKIYKNQGGDSKSIKPVIIKIAGKLALHDEELKIPAKNALIKYTNGDNWYTSFKIAYLKTRIVH